MSGRFTSPVLLGASVVLWLVGMLFGFPVNDVCVFGLQIGNVVSRGITFACFAIAAAMLSSWYLFDRRIHWFLSLVFFLPSVSLFVHGCPEQAFSLLFSLLVQYRLFSCNQGEDNRYGMFTSFALFGLSTMLFPSCIMLLFPFVLYITMSSLVRVKELFSILLGLLTPYWFLFGFDYIFPGIALWDDFVTAPFAYIASPAMRLPSLYNVLLVAFELLVLVPFCLLFARSATPGKPFLRKRLNYFAILELYLIVVSLLYSHDFLLYYIWSLPIMGIMLAYIFSLGITRFSRIYFIVVGIALMAMIPLGLWLIH